MKIGIPVARNAFPFLSFFALSLFALPGAEAADIKLPKAVIVAADVDFPVALCHAGADTILYTEKDGRVMSIKSGAPQKQPVKTLNVASGFEKGLLGIACDEGRVFVYHTYSSGFGSYNRVVRLNPEMVIIDKIPGAAFHNGGALAIGLDGMIYITTGDARDEKSAQNPDSLSGKVLRLNQDGSVPGDNPFRGSPVWSLGHRNVFGIAFNDKGELYITENGTSRDDEINMIIKGGNYGWPVALGFVDDPRFRNPVKTYTPNKAPTNATFVMDWLVFGTWNTGEIIGLRLSGGKALEERVLYRHKSGVTDVKYFPDGYLYFTSKDGIYRAPVEIVR